MTKKTLHPDESGLFRSAVGQVKELVCNTVLLTPQQKPRAYPKAKPVEWVDPLQDMPVDELDTLYQEDKLSFLAPGLQKNVLKKLRKGYYGLDADIDLHGLSSREARRQLLQFLHHCVEEGFRCVHIIHGKGYRSPDNQPILKNDVNLWLRQHQDVLAFCSTSPKDGGAGAVFVLLKLSEKYED